MNEKMPLKKIVMKEEEKNDEFVFQKKCKSVNPWLYTHKIYTHNTHIQWTHTIHIKYTHNVHTYNAYIIYIHVYNVHT